MRAGKMPAAIPTKSMFPIPESNNHQGILVGIPAKIVINRPPIIPKTKPAAPPTVYRALDFLLEHGFIHKLESINAFVGCHQPRVQHSVPFLICDGCNAAVELEDERVTSLLNDQARALGFRPQAQTLEVHGLCSKCSGER